MKPAKAQQWQEVERVIGMIAVGMQGAGALKNALNTLIRYDKYEQLFHLMQKRWPYMEQRDEAIQSLPLA